jgi:hypothetical protein
MRIIKNTESKKEKKAEKKLRKKMGKNIMLILSGLIIMISWLFSFAYTNLRNNFLEELDGEIYYLERMGGVNVLFKSDADLKNTKIVYSHRGKGLDSYGDYNDNIYTFYHDAENDLVKFIAMHEGKWSMFVLDKNSDEVTLAETDRMELPKTNFLKKRYEGYLVYQEEGSLFISYEGRTECIKKFYGVYDDKFTGYRPIGFSPDGKYLVYYSSGHLTMIGTLVEGLISDSPGKTFIMDMETGKSDPYIEASHIQWEMDVK